MCPAIGTQLSRGAYYYYYYLYYYYYYYYYFFSTRQNAGIKSSATLRSRPRNL